MQIHNEQMDNPLKKIVGYKLNIESEVLQSIDFFKCSKAVGYFRAIVGEHKIVTVFACCLSPLRP